MNNEERKDIEDKIKIRILSGDVSTEISERGKKEQAAVLSEGSLESSGGRSFNKFMTGLSYH